MKTLVLLLLLSVVAMNLVHSMPATTDIEEENIEGMFGFS